MQRSLKAAMVFIGVLFFIVQFFAVIGRNLFAYKAIVDTDGEILFKGTEEYDSAIKAIKASGEDDMPDVGYGAHFNNIWEALTSVIIVMLGEDWN